MKKNRGTGLAPAIAKSTGTGPNLTGTGPEFRSGPSQNAWL